jgi:transposase-like protein
MDAAWLAEKLEAGRSIESIARETGRDPSTVAYWVNKYGLASEHAPKHTARGGIDRDALTALVETGKSIRAIAGELGVSATTVRHWLSRFDLQTAGAERRSGTWRRPALVRECRNHGWTTWVRSAPGRYRCRQCRMEAVSARRRRVKEILVREAGGACRLCGYSRYAGALQFHHVDPTEKAFALSSRGLARSLAKARVEVMKCVLLCANCHEEVESGVATIGDSRAQLQLAGSQ